MSKYENTPIATAWYYIINIFTFGSLYFIKIAVKKALSEPDRVVYVKEGKNE